MNAITDPSTEIPAAGSLRSWGKLLTVALAALMLTILAGCQSTSNLPPAATPGTPLQPQVLREGDVVSITFPAAPELNTPQQAIRRDGRISLPLVADVVAAGKTPDQLRQELTKLYSGQLVSSEIQVTVVQSSYDVYVNGQVVRPGKYTVNHQISAFDAVMEAGGFAPDKADTKRVIVIRNTGGRTQRFELNLQKVLDGDTDEPFYLQPGDSVTVPEKFTLF